MVYDCMVRTRQTSFVADFRPHLMFLTHPPPDPHKSGASVSEICIGGERGGGAMGGQKVKSE